jgi:UDP-N-acetylglucosamine 2-epimerase (non-hydrolysing)
MTAPRPHDRPVLVVAGARPNFMKVVPILHELDRRGLPRLFVHTGQHYDVRMSEALLADLGAPPPDVMLEVGSASHAVQTARVMERFEPVLREHRPSWVVVVGDVNSTLACALVVSKLREELGCRLAHVEAGLRSHDWAMPEEVNRVLTDRLSDLLLTPSTDVGDNLRREGLDAIRTAFVGNVMIDSLLAVLPRARSLDLLPRLGVRPGHVLATLHRPSNVDEPARLAVLLEALAQVAESRQVVFPIHPRTRARVAEAGLGALLEKLVVTDPVGYAEIVALEDSAAAVVTDSGGLQEETTVLGVPCLTLREQTERPITVTHGTNRMLPWPPTVDGIVSGVAAAVVLPRAAVGARSPEGWDGKAASRIVDALR